MAPDQVAEFCKLASAALGPKGWTVDADMMDPWLTDWRGRYTGRAVGLASPGSTEEVSAFVRLCAEFGVPIVPQGGNSSMSGGATPDESGTSVLLSLRRMNRIHLDSDARLAICDAGVVLQTLHEAATRHGLRFPLMLGGKGSATIGGLIATNAGGTQVLQHGTMRAQVSGLEAVLANGDVLDLMSGLKKDNRGFDLKQLLIGSEGTLGIVTAASLKLIPDIGERIVAWIGLDSPSAARDALALAERKAGRFLEGFELLPESSLTAVLDYLPDARRPLEAATPWHALLEFAAPVGQESEVRRAVEAVLEEAFDTESIADAAITQNERQVEAFWSLRDSISPAERAQGPAMQHDISVPVARMAEFIEHAVPLVERRFTGTRALAFGHLGDGNVHFHVQAPKDAIPGNWEEDEGKAISALVHDLVTQWDGSISAEHGIGQMKIDELERLHQPVALDVMRAVKQALDPQSLLNPGKLVRPSARESGDDLAPDGSNA